jgi:hypothetical protein
MQWPTGRRKKTHCSPLRSTFEASAQAGQLPTGVERHTPAAWAWLAALRRAWLLAARLSAAGSHKASAGLRALTEGIRRLDQAITRWALPTGISIGPGAVPVRDEYRTGCRPTAPRLSLDPWSECPTCQALGRDGS